MRNISTLYILRAEGRLGFRTIFLSTTAYIQLSMFVYEKIIAGKSCYGNHYFAVLTHHLKLMGLRPHYFNMLFNSICCSSISQSFRNIFPNKPRLSFNHHCSDLTKFLIVENFIIGNYILTVYPHYDIIRIERRLKAWLKKIRFLSQNIIDSLRI